MRRPSSVPALNTLMAISPRLAAMILLNGTSPVWKVCKQHPAGQDWPQQQLLSVGCCFCIGSHLETIVVGHTSDNIPADAFLYFQGLNARLLGQGRWYYRRAGTMLLWWATLWPAGLLAHVQHIARNNTTPRGRDLLHLHAASSA